MSGRPVLVVVDTNLFVSALFIGSAAAMSMLQDILQTAVPVFSLETLAELEAKSRMAKFDRYIPLEERAEAVEKLKMIARIVVVTESVRICRDPKDDIFLALARSAGADALVSGDRDLLVLEQFEGIPILTPRQWHDTRAGGNSPPEI